MANVNTNKFKKLIIRIPEEQFPDRLTLVIKGYTPTEEMEALERNDPRVQQLVANALNNPAERVYEFRFIKENNFKTTSTIDGMSYKIYNEKFPLTEITQVHGWADRDDTEDETPVEVTMSATTESGRKSSTAVTTINMDDVWAYSFSMTRQSMTPDTILAYWFNGTETGAITTALIDMASYLIETLIKLPSAIAATPKAILSKFLGPNSPIVQSALADIATKLASVQPQVDQITLIVTILQEFVSNPEEASVKYGMLLLSFMLEKLGPAAFGSTVYDFFGGYPVAATPLDSISTAMEALDSVESEY